jgi:hypothetical protein
MRGRLRRLSTIAVLGSILAMAGCGHHQTPVTALPPAPVSPKAGADLQQGIASVNAAPGLSDAEKVRRIAILQRQFGGGRP